MAILVVPIAADGTAQTRTLDLTIEPTSLSAMEEHSQTTRGGDSATSETHALPLRLTLLELDRTSYRRSDSVVFTVALQNVGRRPVVIPWSKGSAEVKNLPPRQTLRGLLALQFLDERGVMRVAGGATLTAPRASKSDMTTLRPGETVHIKAMCGLVFTEDTLAWLQSRPEQDPVQMVATFRLADGASRRSDLVVSDGHMDVRLSK